MASKILPDTELAIAVFYPGSSLLHQVSAWAVACPQYHFEISFADESATIRATVGQAAMSIIDATEAPGRAMDAFIRATAEVEAVSVVVYTERMYQGLELFVRSRGALLLLGPMSDVQWKETFDTMATSIRRQSLPVDAARLSRSAATETEMEKPVSRQTQQEKSSRKHLRKTA